MKPQKLLKGYGVPVELNPDARPRFYPGGPRGVLLIHGFSGHPGEMDYLGQELNRRGFTVSIPRLPGHGTGRTDFLHSDGGQWLRCALDAWLELRSLCLPGGTADMAGLSMGGLLAILLAAAAPPRRLVLAAPALRVTNPLLPFTPLARHFLKEMPRKLPENLTDPHPERDYYFLATPTAQAAELLGLQRLARRRLPEVKVPCLTVVSRKDRTVPLSILPLLEKRGGFSRLETLVLEESGHVVVNDAEKEAAAGRILAFLEEEGTG